MNTDQATSAIAEPVTDDDLALLEAALLESRLVVKSNPNHEPAGSPEGGQFTHGDGGTGSVFSSALSKGSSAWRREAQKSYDTNTQFRAAADAITYFTQGEYNNIRAISQHAVTGEWDARYKDGTVPSWLDLPMSGNPLASYKSYFKGQDMENGSNVTWGEGARAINDAIRTADPLPVPIYRGVSDFGHPNGREMIAGLKALKPGDPFDVLGASSFTTSEELAYKFSLNMASGQHGGLQHGGHPAVIEVQPGARGLSVQALSPYRQAEVISSGHFEVVSVTETPKEVYVPNGGYSTTRNELRVVVKQVGVWSNKS